MKYRIEFLDAARREFEALPRAVQRRLVRRIDAFEKDPRPPGGQPLRGSLKGRRRLRVGDYRVIYTIEDEVLVVLVVAVGHRRGGL